jgi:hypothetical protein
VAPIQTFDPARMTSPQRRTEAAALLAVGLYRLRDNDADTAAVGGPSPVCLGFDGHPRVHANPAHRSPQA